MSTAPDKEGSVMFGLYAHTNCSAQQLVFGYTGKAEKLQSNLQNKEYALAIHNKLYIDPEVNPHVHVGSYMNRPKKSNYLQLYVFLIILNNISSGGQHL
jgi:hypothetical protein